MGTDAPGLVISVPLVVLRMMGAVVGEMVVLLASRALRVLVASRMGMGGGGGALVAVDCACVVIGGLVVVKGVDAVVVVELVEMVVVEVVVVEVVVVMVAVVCVEVVDCLDHVYLSLVCACAGDGRGEG